METFDLAKFFDFETKVKITTKDQKTFSGVITGIDDGLDTESGVDEVELYMGTYYLGIEVPDIDKIEKV